MEKKVGVPSTEYKNKLQASKDGVSSSEHVRSDADWKQHGGRVHSRKRKRKERRTVPAFLANAYLGASYLHQSTTTASENHHVLEAI